MKKILFLALMLLSMTTVMAQLPLSQNAEGYYEVHNADQLKEAIEISDNVKIQLMADIDASHLRQICGTFKGIITGKYKKYIEGQKEPIDAMHVIYGGSDKGGAKTWLFDKVEDATFDYIYFKNFRVEHDGDQNGSIAQEAINSKFTNLVLDSISVYENDNDAGAIVGTAKGCLFETIMSKSCDVMVDGKCAGCLVGTSTNSIFKLCINYITSGVYADGSCGDARAGGFVGESNYDTFEYCTNAGLVCGRSDDLGGIVGKSNKSKFISCENHTAVLFAHEEGNDKQHIYYKNLLNQIREKISTLPLEDRMMLEAQFVRSVLSTAELAGVLVAEGLVTGVITGVIVYNFVQLQTGVWIGTIPQINRMVALCGSEYSYAIKNAWLKLSGQVLSVVTIVVAATLIAIEVYKYFTNYDDVGGICGLAIESEFEKCINNGILYCDDTFCGGIVGDAKGGKFNNCLNTGKIYTKEGASRGGIVGSIVGDDFFFRRQQKITITNCISTQDDPILGNDDDDSKNSEWNVAYGSGNNYRLKNNRKSNRLKFIEMQVDSAQLTDGTVAFWLNNGAENRNLAVKPWRQNLSGEARDSFPVLNKNHHEVVLKDLKHKSIRTEKDLREFAKEVNDGEQFCNAILENDIEMNSDVPWTPIGTKAHCWRGSFDGQGYTISGLKCSVAKNSNEGAGLFGTVDVHADIRNVILDSSCEIENNSATGAGGIVGTIRSHLCGDVLIRNCGNYGKINGYQHVGGILGRVINDTKEHGNFVQVVVDSCFNAGSVMADGYSGLLCGYMQNYGVVSNCWSNGSLKQSGRHRVFSMDNPKGEAEYFVGYYQALKIDKCYDYLSKVDWDNIVVEKKCQQGVTLKLNCTMGCTIKFDVGTGTCGNDRLTEAKPNAGIVLPKVTPLEGWTFVGWSTEKVETETDVEPKTIVGTADATYMPKENITLYAVYSKDIIADNKPLTIYNSLPENIGVTVSSAQYTTLYYSDKNLVVPEGIEANTYKFTSKNEFLKSFTYKSGMVIPKGEAVELHAIEKISDKKEFYFAETMVEPEKDSENVLRGTDEATLITAGYNNYIYRQLNGDNGVGFYMMPDDEVFTNKAHKAYLILSYAVKSAANAPAYAPRLFAEGTTSINSTVNDTENSGIVYNHMGNRVNSNYRGIVIVNGRKVMKSR